MGKSMTARQRLLATIRHEEPDMVPVAPRADNFYKEYYGCACWMHELKAAEEFDFDPVIYLEPNYQHLEDVAKSYIPINNYVKGWAYTYEDLNNVKIDICIERKGSKSIISRTIDTPAGKLTDKRCQALPGTEYGTWPDPYIIEHLVKGPEDLPKLKYILPDHSKAHLADIREIIRIVGHRGLVETPVCCALDHKAMATMGQEAFMMAMHDNPEFFKELISLFHQDMLSETNALLEAGSEMIYGYWFYCSPSVGWSPEIYKKWFLPLLKEHVKLVHSYNAIYHYYDDGKIMAILPMLKEAGIDVLSTLCPPPVGDVDLAEAKHLVGDTICLKGYTDLFHVIKKGTPESIKVSVRDSIRIGAPGGGFILGTSDCIREAPINNVKAFFHAGREFGKYPIQY